MRAAIVLLAVAAGVFLSDVGAHGTLNDVRQAASRQLLQGDPFTQFNEAATAATAAGGSPNLIDRTQLSAGGVPAASTTNTAVTSSGLPVLTTSTGVQVRAERFRGTPDESRSHAVGYHIVGICRDYLCRE
eukprot:jgi/Chrzof1/9544/Cz04g07090.t1